MVGDPREEDAREQEVPWEVSVLVLREEGRGGKDERHDEGKQQQLSSQLFLGDLVGRKHRLGRGVDLGVRR